MTSQKSCIALNAQLQSVQELHINFQSRLEAAMVTGNFQVVEELADLIESGLAGLEKNIQGKEKEDDVLSCDPRSLSFFEEKRYTRVESIRGGAIKAQLLPNGPVIIEINRAGDVAIMQQDASGAWQQSQHGNRLPKNRGKAIIFPAGTQQSMRPKGWLNGGLMIRTHGRTTADQRLNMYRPTLDGGWDLANELTIGTFNDSNRYPPELYCEDFQPLADGRIVMYHDDVDGQYHKTFYVWKQDLTGTWTREAIGHSEKRSLNSQVIDPTEDGWHAVLHEGKGRVAASFNGAGRSKDLDNNWIYFWTEQPNNVWQEDIVQQDCPVKTLQVLPDGRLFVVSERGGMHILSVDEGVWQTEVIQSSAPMSEHYWPVPGQSRGIEYAQFLPDNRIMALIHVPFEVGKTQPAQLLQLWKKNDGQWLADTVYKVPHHEFIRSFQCLPDGRILSVEVSGLVLMLDGEPLKQ